MKNQSSAKPILTSRNLALQFQLDAETKAFDREHRRKIRFNIGKYDAAVALGMNHFQDHELARTQVPADGPPPDRSAPRSARIAFSRNTPRMPTGIDPTTSIQPRCSLGSPLSLPRAMLPIIAATMSRHSRR